ncbi:hypothetical protein L873DRAFT_1382501 [Choiromyces venosus 120613-1]|uniref:Uncharacterized protein n=1 Tax=Choiromyces venosus 120613-1 TaxID=1336337 RepID=A0A3N4JEW0_9PEZI|nr:hypothetical protein L873DRAFT_1382501 [Choiromyces venosus 120613-1]
MLGFWCGTGCVWVGGAVAKQLFLSFSSHFFLSSLTLATRLAHLLSSRSRCFFLPVASSSLPPRRLFFSSSLPSLFFSSSSLLLTLLSPPPFPLSTPPSILHPPRPSLIFCPSPASLPPFPLSPSSPLPRSLPLSTSPYLHQPFHLRPI